MSLINPLTAQEILAFLSVPDSDLLDQPLGAVDSNMNAAPESAQELFNTDLSTPALRCVTPNPLEQDAWDEISTDPDEANVKEQSDDSDEPFTKEAHENLTRTDANAAVKHEYDAEDQFHSAMSDTKEPWVRIIPRRGNALENRPVVITLEVLSKHFHERHRQVNYEACL
ncbi:hypothetical protein GUITHDRAFT_155148 [Guillardia theta CCMP2712]|uniref:Uncharacterized protein n=1 Tax=Guillardia theta (strain CCMP2712) TaxID=905079 RepID=L1IKN3_GUITC|nr:hypothetical protein GUITHDRAFT_155148 [Guillardia theta CCMP2712]EKX36781.1 hypothetical protein GUITHDRAFT_155148 [Guillardia theta CCMP2712]|eukprot:XP_005823761.1 hypothetical protein GUITHDRAFT_155148 [Guillardia theta CCMP2712]